MYTAPTPTTTITPSPTTQLPLRLLCVVISDHKINMRILKFYFFTICVRISFALTAAAAAIAPCPFPSALPSLLLYELPVAALFCCWLFSSFVFCCFVVHLIHAMKDLARSSVWHMFCPFSCVLWKWIAMLWHIFLLSSVLWVLIPCI